MHTALGQTSTHFVFICDCGGVLNLLKAFLLLANAVNIKAFVSPRKKHPLLFKHLLSSIIFALIIIYIF